MKTIINLLLLILCCTPCLAGEPMLTIRLDGGSCYYQDVYPLLTEHGMTATVYMPTNSFGPLHEGHCLNWKMLRELQANGWEIGSHTITHPDLRTLNDEQLTIELKRSKRILEAHGLTITSFGCPKGYYNERVLTEIKKYYPIHAATRPYGLNAYPLKHYSLVVRLMQRTDTVHITVNDMKGWIDEAINRGEYIILLFHGIENVDPSETEQGHISLSEFHEIIDYIQLTGIRTVNISQAFDY